MEVIMSVNDKKSIIAKYGKELFSTKGFKDTKVDAIMKKSKLSTGSFYNYFTSKDQLFMEIFIEENIKLKQSILKKVDFDGEPMAVMVELMGLNMQGFYENPILREWYNKEVFAKIEKNYKKECGVENLDFLFSEFYDLIKMWQDLDKIRKDIDASMIMAIFSALINIDTHKEEIGLQYFPMVMDYLAEFIMKGLITKI
jgi:AcrR family transcriptional regulator